MNLYSDTLAGATRFVEPNMAVGVQMFVNSSSPLYMGASITDANIFTVVKNATKASPPLPLSGAAMYVVATSSEIAESGPQGAFCAQYCSWHAEAAYLGTKVIYIFVGQPSAACLPSCSSNAGYVTPNAALPNGAAADAMASSLVHEMSEAATDPIPGTARGLLTHFSFFFYFFRLTCSRPVHFNDASLLTRRVVHAPQGWYNSTAGQECADKCVYTYGSVINNSYNVALSTGNFLLQQAWQPINGVCALSP